LAHIAVVLDGRVLSRRKKALDGIVAVDDDDADDDETEKDIGVAHAAAMVAVDMGLVVVVDDDDNEVENNVNVNDGAMIQNNHHPVMQRADMGIVHGT
jgi:hypothetical protein